MLMMWRRRNLCFRPSSRPSHLDEGIMKPVDVVGRIGFVSIVVKQGKQRITEV